jgi:hypothetical protein
LLRTGPEGDPQSDLVSALRHSKRHHAVDADGSEEECETGKTREEHRDSCTS